VATPPEVPTIDGRTVSASAVVAAPPEEIFALLADPHRHHEFDGSGTVKDAVSGPRQLTLGDRFGMGMRNGLPYRTVNRVIEFEPNRRIAWCHAAKAVWRYELEPVEGGTLVTETFDYRTAPLRLFFELLGMPKGNAKSIQATLARLQTIFA
jgi:uncharacterized protein YndB with AHSA1/START domain